MDDLIGIVIIFWIGFGLGIYSGMSTDQPTTVTPESKFVVQEIQAKEGRWKYTLENINLQNSNELPILTIETSAPYGYKTGDTLQVLNYNIPQLNRKLQ